MFGVGRIGGKVDLIWIFGVGRCGQRISGGIKGGCCLEMIGG